MWLFIIILVALVADYALTPGPSKTSPGTVSGAIATPGASIPVLFGTRELTQPMIVWYGDIDTVAVKSSAGKK